jgi:quercetin dioxygenase-like cupin family protein
MNDDLFEGDAFFVDAEELEAEKHPWGGRKFLVNGSLFPDAEQTVSLVWIAPGKEDPLHRHPNAEQVTHVLGGECEFQLEDALYHLVAGDTLRVPRGAEHQATNTGWEPCRLLLAFSSPAVETVFSEPGG